MQFSCKNLIFSYSITGVRRPAAHFNLQIYGLKSYFLKNIEHLLKELK